ncbi:MAG: ribosome biogenesis GTPase Der [Aquimonas sp.]|nr:ribosome biogenesis GTPase Der [Aquimonas sp.]
MLPLVALVGRPNVGKSTLFNVLTRSRDALVADQPGLTRDRQYGVCRLGERPFMVVDTGGIGSEEGSLGERAEVQSWAAVEEAEVLLFIVDGRAGITPDDSEILSRLRRQSKPIVLAVNKTDGLDEQVALAEFARLGIETRLPVAASHGRGMQQLMEAVYAQLPAVSSEEADPALEDPAERLRLAIVGRPNVGKSTLVNRICGEERVLASEVAGTTRDSIPVDLEREGRKYRLVDTAGIRRKARVEEVVEKFSVIKALQAIEQSEVVVFMVDASEGVTDQDATVLGHVLQAQRALVIAVNKWDGLSQYQKEQCKADLERRLAFVSYAQIVTISARHGTGLRELFRAVHRAHESAHRHISTPDINRALEMAFEAFQPPMLRGHVAKLRYAHMAGHNPPTIVIHGSRLKTLPDSYKRYLENFFRKRFKLVGTPVALLFRDGDNPYKDKPKAELTDRQKSKRKRLMQFAKRKS